MAKLSFYLDFSCLQKQAATALAALEAHASDAKIVLSSAWRYLVHRGEMNLNGLEWLLRSHGVLAGRLHGITRKDSERKTMSWDGTYASWVHGNERGKQIAEYLGNDRSIPYAVVDDLDLNPEES